MTSDFDHRLLSTSFGLSFNAHAGSWTLYVTVNEGYQDLGNRTISPAEALEIAKGLDHLLHGEAGTYGRHPYTELVEDAHAAAKRSLADEIKNLDAAMLRREAKVQALAAFEDPS